LENNGLIRKSEDQTERKRKRRKAQSIDRKYKCPYNECPRAYGTEGALKYHFKTKHKDQEYIPPQQPSKVQSNETTVGPLVIPRLMPSFHMNPEPFLPIAPEFLQGSNINLLNSMQQNNNTLYSPGSKVHLPMLSPNINNLILHENSLSHHESGLHNEMNHLGRGNELNHLGRVNDLNHLGRGNELDVLESDIEDDIDD